MKKRLLCLMASLLLCGAAIAQEPAYVRLHDNNMPVVAQVVLDEVPVTTSEWTLKAYIGDDQRGEAVIQTSLNNTYWIQVYYSTDTEDGTPVTFKIANANNQEYTSTTTLNTLAEGYGTPLQPQEIEFVATQTQSMAMASGWNWWSTYIEQQGINGLELLENSLGENGVYITTQGKNVENYFSSIGYNYWWGNLEEIQNEVGYKLMLSSSCNVSMPGRIAVPEQHPIQIKPNWNWIGYPCTTTQLIANANFQPSNNDIIQTQGIGSTYYEGYGWWPDFTMEPQKGYLYYSTSSENKSLVFSNSRELTSPVERPRFWNNDVRAYEDNIVIIAKAFSNLDELDDEQIEIGAFVNGENRGSSRLMYFQPLDQYFALFTITGQKGDLVEFRMINTRNGEESANCDTRFTFEPYSTHGTLDNPIELHFGISNNSTIDLYPNPLDRNQSFTLVIPREEKAEQIIITNELGVVVRNEQGEFSNTMIKGLPVSGIYTVKVICESSRVYYSKLIVK